jgi:hypothetical protein
MDFFHGTDKFPSKFQDSFRRGRLNNFMGFIFSRHAYAIVINGVGILFQIKMTHINRNLTEWQISLDDHEFLYESVWPSTAKKCHMRLLSAVERERSGRTADSAEEITRELT